MDVNEEAQAIEPVDADSWNTIERRKALRIVSKIPVALVDSDLEPGNVGACANVSETGLRLKAQKVLPESPDLTLKLTLPQPYAPIEGMTKVIWRNDSKKEYGIAFVEWADGGADILDRYINRDTRSIALLMDRRARERRLSPAGLIPQNKRRIERRGQPKFMVRALSWQKRLNDWQAAGNYFFMRSIDSASAHKVTLNGKAHIMFSSNNFLGLTTHPKVVEAAVKALKEYGTGSGAARLIGGTMKLHKMLEERIARFKNAEDAVVYSAGYLANLGTISCLLGRNDVAILDDKDHASIIDGCLLSKCRIRTFQHSDMADLDRQLTNTRKDVDRLVIVDGVFSMDGDIANLPQIYKLVKKYRATLMVDDAHSTGAIGKHGRGTAEHFNMEGMVDITVGTFSKALGANGGFVCGKKELVSMLRHFSRAFVFSTSFTPAVCATLIAAIDVLENEPELVEMLRNKAEFLRKGLKAIGYNTGLSETHIIPVLIGHETKMYQVIKFLFDEGIMASPVTRPAVPRNGARVRLSVMATHTQEDLEKTLEVFKEAYLKFGPFEVSDI